MSQGNGYIQKIKQAIQACNKTIKEVNNLEFVKVLDYSDENLKTVNEIIINGKFDELERLQADTTKEDNLIVMNFKDENSNVRIATIYDNEQLWHDPRVIAIYYFKNTAVK